jgi:hypothetical protein
MHYKLENSTHEEYKIRYDWTTSDHKNSEEVEHKQLAVIKYKTLQYLYVLYKIDYAIFSTYDYDLYLSDVDSLEGLRNAIKEHRLKCVFICPCDALFNKIKELLNNDKLSEEGILIHKLDELLVSGIRNEVPDVVKFVDGLTSGK